MFSSQDIQNLQNGKRSVIEFHQELTPLNGTIALNEWNKKKRRKVSSFEQQQSAQQNIETVPGINDFRVWNLQYMMKINEKLNIYLFNLVSMNKKPKFFFFIFHCS